MPRKSLLQLLLYLLASGALILYLLFSGNEYAWMQNMNPGARLPEDPDQAFKRALFGIPAVVLVLTAIIHALLRGSGTGKLFALLFGVGATWMLIPSTGIFAPWSDGTSMELMPLSPYQREFTTSGGLSRTVYFVAETHGDWREEKYRARLKESIANTVGDAPKTVATYSLILYEKTADLNETFSGDMEALRGLYDSDLISFTRWQQGRMDIFYLMEKGNVVYDLLENEPVDPPWKFD